MSNLPTVNVTARVYDQSGKPVHKAIVTMRLTTVERYAGYIVPKEVRAETDATGKAVLSVWSNELGTEKSEYRVHITYPHNGCESSCFAGGSGSVSAYAVVPNHDCDLQDIMELSPTEYRGAGQVITSEVAMYAGQASTARDAAQKYAQAAQNTVELCTNAATSAGAAQLAAQTASQLATIKADEAGKLVERANDRIVYFEEEVTRRVETEVGRLTSASTESILSSKNEALTQLEQRTAQVIMEVTSTAVDLKTDAVKAVTRAQEQAVDALDKGKEEGLAAFHEEGELFREDFLQLTDRAESAAKKAGCASIAAQNHANRACECSKNAELAADAVAKVEANVIEAARAAELSKTCAEAAATTATVKAAEITAKVETAITAAGDAKLSAQSARRDAILAEQSFDDAVVARDNAKASATDAALHAVSAKAEADRAKIYADDVEAGIQNAALDLLTPQVVTEAVTKATSIATTAAGEAQMHAEDAQFSATDARNTAVVCKNNANRGEEALSKTEDIAGKMLKDYNMETHMVDMSTELIRMSDRLTRFELGMPVPGTSTDPGGTSPSPGVRVAPVTVVTDGVTPPEGSAITVRLTDYSETL
ncbi:MAG: hypothetical protein RR014_00380 [Bilophila sp.]